MHTLSMRVLNVSAALREDPEAFEKAKENPQIDLFFESKAQPWGKMNRTTEISLPKQCLQGPTGAFTSLSKLGAALGIAGLARSLLDYAKSEALAGIVRKLSAGQSNFQAERFNMIEVPVAVFQDPDSHTMHKLRCTGESAFQGGDPRNDWVWVEVGKGLGATGDLRGRLPGQLRGLFKLRDPSNVCVSHRLAVVELLWPVNGGVSDPYDTLIRV